MIIKFIFFMFFAGMGNYFPYITLFLKRAALTGSQIGVLMALQPVTESMASVSWGMLADSRHWHHRIFLICSLGVALTAPFYILADSFLAFFVLQIILFMMISPLIPIINKIVLGMKDELEIDYGKSRVYGSIGFAILAILVGQIAEIFSLKVIFIFMFFTFLMVFFAGLKLPDIESESSYNFRSDLQKLLKIKELFLFLIAIVVLRVGAYAASTYFGILMDSLGSGEGLLGFSWAGAALIEVPIFYFSTKLLLKKGLKKVLLFSFLMTFFQVFLYNFVTTPFLGLIVHLLRGTVFPIYYIAGINYVQEKSPEGVETTAQTLYVVSSFGISGLLGNFLGGYIYDNFGISMIYNFASIMTLIAVIIFVCFFYRNEIRNILVEE